MAFLPSAASTLLLMINGDCAVGSGFGMVLTLLTPCHHSRFLIPLKTAEYNALATFVSPRLTLESEGMRWEEVRGGENRWQLKGEHVCLFQHRWPR